MKIKGMEAVAAPEKLTRENAVARRREAPPHGAGVKDLIEALEQEHPEIAAHAPISSAAVEAGALVRSGRLAANLSQRELAQAAGLRQPALSAIERGEGKDGPTFRKLRDLAAALGMQIALVPKEESARDAGQSAAETCEIADVLGAEESARVAGQSAGETCEIADVLGALEKWLACEAGLPGGVDWTRVNVLFVGPHGVVRERSPVKRSLYRMGGDGRFIHGGRYTNQMSVNVSDGEEVDIVNTGEGIVVAVEFSEAGEVTDDRGAGDER